MQHVIRKISCYLFSFTAFYFGELKNLGFCLKRYEIDIFLTFSWRAHFLMWRVYFPLNKSWCCWYDGLLIVFSLLSGQLLLPSLPEAWKKRISWTSRYKKEFWTDGPMPVVLENWAMKNSLKKRGWTIVVQKDKNWLSCRFEEELLKKFEFFEVASKKKLLDFLWA